MANTPHPLCCRLPAPQVTEDDLEQFHASFKGGEEERGELLKYYRQFKGDMSKVRLDADCEGWGRPSMAVGRGAVS